MYLKLRDLPVAGGKTIKYNFSNHNINVILFTDNKSVMMFNKPKQC